MQLGAAEQQPRQLRRQVGFTPPPLGLLGARARELGQAGRDNGRHEEHPQRNPVLRLDDREAAGGRDVEEVEAHCGRDSRRDPEPQPPDRRHKQHGQQIHQPSETAGAISLSGYTSKVVSASEPAATSTPSTSDERVISGCAESGRTRGRERLRPLALVEQRPLVGRGAEAERAPTSASAHDRLAQQDGVGRPAGTWRWLERQRPHERRLPQSSAGKQTARRASDLRLGRRA